MSPELRDEIETELTLLATELADLRSLLSSFAPGRPDSTQTKAAAVCLHSFYNGIENIFKRVATRVDGGPPTGQFRHADLLDSMSKPTPARPGVLSDNLAKELRKYMQFRHFFRHGYAHFLRWDEMAPLAVGCEAVFARFKSEVMAFLASLPEHS